MDLPATFVFDDEKRLVRVFRSEIDTQRVMNAMGRVPLTAEDYVGFGSSILNKENAEAMLKAFTRSVQMDSKNPRAHWRLGKGYMAVEKFEDAKKAFLKAVELSSEDAEIMTDLALAYLNLDDKVNYRKSLEQAVRRGKSERAHNEYGLALEELEQYALAAEHYTKAAQLNPSYYVALVNLRRLRAKQKDGAGVRVLTERLTKLGYKEPKQTPALQKNKPQSK